MRLAATIEVQGRVRALAAGQTPQPNRVSFRNDGEMPRTPYVDGKEVGELLDWPVEEADSIYDAADDRHAGGRIVHRTTLRAVLELP